MAKVSGNAITDFSQDWGHDEDTNLPFSGEAVQNFIKQYLRQVIGAAWFDPTSYVMYFFENAEDRDTFISDTSQTSLVKFSCQMSFDSTLYRVNITNYNGSTVINTATNAGTLPLSASFVVQKKDLGELEWEDTQTYCDVTIYIDRGVTGNFVPVTETARYAPGSVIEYDIFPELITGTSRVRFTFEAEDGSVTQSLLYTITMAELYVDLFNNTWYMPIIGGNTDTYYLGGFRIGGAGSKTLHFEIYDQEGNQVIDTIDDLIGTTNIYASTPYFYRFNASSPILGLETGTYRVKVYVTTENMTSETIEYGIMYVASVDVNTAQLVVVNSVAEKVFNYSDDIISQFSAYNMGLSSCDVGVEFRRMQGETVVDTSTTGLTGISTSSPQYLTYSAEWDVQGEGYYIGFEVSLGDSADGAVVPLDNSTVFPPQSGFDFYMNSATRNNGDANREKAVNTVGGTEYTAAWSMVDYIDGVDGWTTDNNGRKCLRIPAGTSFTLPASQYQLFRGDGMTLEICYKVANVADWDEEVITLGTNLTAPNFRGLKIKPTNITLHAGNESVDVLDTQRGTNVSDEEVIHLGITIDRTFYNGNKIVKGFVNGGKNFAFSYTDSAAWNIPGDLVIAPQKSDVFIYFVRHYPVVLTDAMMQNNYISSLTSVEERTSTEENFNSCMDDGMTNVTLEAVKDSGYNYFVVHMEGNDKGVPSKANGWSNDTEKLSSLEMHFGQHPEWDWQIFSTKTTGQGTTSMNYYRWNIRWRIDKNTNKIAPVRYLSSRTRVNGSYQYTWGATSNASTVHFDGQGNHPAVMRITAKINQASSMQSHKMGATMAYTILHDAIGLENEAQAKARTEGKPHPTVAVYQYPAFGFQDDGNGNYSYCGLFTIGPDKGDKPTFGMDLVKSSLITMEGTDHSQPLAKFDHPWGSDVNFFYTQEGLAIAMPNGTYLTGLEVGNCHGKDTDKATGQADVRSILETEFKPAYDLTWENSTLIFPIALGTYGATAAATLAAINSSDENVRKAFRETSYDGRLKYGDMQFWIEGERKLYYYDIKTDMYVAGQQLGTKTGTLEQQNEAYKADRRAAFMAHAEDYFDIGESAYHFLFLLIIGATDNHAKNMYPYKMATLQNGGRWRWWQDDLDSILDIDNSGGDTKPYYIEFEDGNSGVPYFAGSSSIFWNLFFECYWGDYTSTATGLPSEGIRSMGKRVLKAMTSTVQAGNDYEGFINFFKTYFWDKAQAYFPVSGYNVDQFFKYEQAKFGGDNGGVDALIQELGNHYSAEQLWVRRRAIYMLSLFGAGPFGDYSDASLGTLQFRPMAFSTAVTPSMWLYPALGVGQATPVSPGRTEPGQSATMTAVGIDGNTFIYLQGTNCLSSLGNLKNVVLATGYVNAIEIPGKTLTSFAIGDPVASNVTTNIPAITFGNRSGHTNCLELIDARNASSISVIDVSNVPRLRKLLLAGTSITDVSIPRGSKINELSLPATMTALRFRDLKHLPYENITLAGTANIKSLVVEHCLMDALSLLGDIMDGSSELEFIRCIWDGTITDTDGSIIEMLSDVATGDYKGLLPDGSETPNPVIEGQMALTGSSIPVSVFGPVSLAYPTIIFNDEVNDQVYIDFADSNVEAIALANWNTDSDSTHLSLREAKAVTTLSTLFRTKTTITSFDELKYFTGLLTINGTGTSLGSNSGAFYACSNLKSVELPNTVNTISNYAFGNCTSLMTVGSMLNVMTIGLGAFQGCSALSIELYLPSLSGTLERSAFYGSGITKIANLGRITATYNGTVNEGAFRNCLSLSEAILPSSLASIGSGLFMGCTSLSRVDMSSCNNLTTIGASAFKSCTSLEDVSIPSSVQTIGAEAFSGSKLSGVLDLPNLKGEIGSDTFKGTLITKITSLGEITKFYDSHASYGAFNGCSLLTEVTLPTTLINLGSGTFRNCTSLTTVHGLNSSNHSIITIAGSCFEGCTSLTGEVNLPLLLTLSNGAFYRTQITKIISLGNITVTADGATNGASCTFSSCTALTEVNLPPSLTTIGIGTFHGDTALTTITGGSGVTRINNSAFYGCSSLTSVSFPSLTTLGDGAFRGCTSLSSADLGSSLTTISTNAFYDCTSLSNLTLPATLTTISGTQAFFNCTNMGTMTFLSTTPPTLGNANVFQNCKAFIRVPGASVSAYMTATNWKTWVGKIMGSDGNVMTAVTSGIKLSRVSNVDQFVAADGYAITNMVPLRNVAHAIELSYGEVYSGTDGDGVCMCFDTNYLRLTHYNRVATDGEAKRTFTPASGNANIAYLRMTFKASELANCYIYDTVDNVYLWKGSDVTTIY